MPLDHGEQLSQAALVTTSEAKDLQRLRDELAATRASLAATTERLKATNAQLTRANELLRDQLEQQDGSHDNLHDILQGTGIAAMFLDRELRLERFTRTAGEVFHVRNGDVGRPITELTATPASSGLVEDARAVLRSREPQEREVESEDRRCSLLVRTLPRRLADDTVKGVVITVVDLSAQRLAEEHRAALGAIVESADEAIWAKTLDGTITSWNGAAERIYGFSADEMIGATVLQLVPPDRLAEVHDMHERIARGEHVDRVETVRITRDGRRLDVSVSIAPIRDRSGRITGASSISHDVSWQRRAEHDLIAARDAAEFANRAKDQFLAILSHELRTPLTPVLVAAGLLAGDASLSAASRAKVELIRRNVELEARLIDDLLDVTGIARGNIELHRKVVAVGDLVAHALEVCSSDLGAVGVQVDVNVANNLWVEIDAARMQQVLWSLLRNAARFSPSGTRVTVSAKQHGQSVVLQVTDRGAGIAPEQLAGVFDAFQQAQVVPAKRTGGLGLGLAISKALVEAHGGTIRAESGGLGTGSTFTVTLGAVVAPGLAAGGMPDASEEVAVLLVEDHEDTLELMSELLSREGYAVTVARTVREAQSACATKRLDVIVSDLGLPDGSGHDVVLAARTQTPCIPAIALSGYGMEDDRKRSAEAGFAEHLVKPVGFRDLQAAIRRAVGR